MHQSLLRHILLDTAAVVDLNRRTSHRVRAAPATMRWATGMLKPTQPRKCSGCALSSARIADSYSSMPLPSITVWHAVQKMIMRYPPTACKSTGRTLLVS